MPLGAHESSTKKKKHAEHACLVRFKTNKNYNNFWIENSRWIKC